MFNLSFDYFELISLNFYKIVFKPVSFNNNFFDNLLSIIRQNIFNTPGYAVTELSLKGIKSEFGYLPGLKEDILNLILNIKNIIFKLNKVKDLSINLSSKNKNIITGFDIKKNNYFKIINPNQIICHLNDNTDFNLKLKVEKGVGYLPSKNNKNYKKKKRFKNGILIDANFCPILRVSYVVKNIKNYFYNNFKKIIFFIETNGSINVKKSFINSVNSILKNFPNFKFFKKKSSGFFLENFNKSLSVFDCGFTIRTLKILVFFNIFFLNDFLKCSKNDLFNFKSLTDNTILEIKNILNLYDLFF